MAENLSAWFAEAQEYDIIVSEVNMFNIVLVEPEIPQNTGNIVRTAAATGGKVHLVEPLGFDISDKALKRAGLDYWHLTDFIVYKDLEDFFAKNARGRYRKSGESFAVDAREGEPAFYFFSTKAARRYDEAHLRPGDFLVFGKETKGLSEELLHENYENTLRIPMRAEARSLNLSNSVAVAVYEGLRQNSFAGLLVKGALRTY